MLLEHLDLDDLTPDRISDLSDKDKAHLSQCPRCRIEARLLARMHNSADPDLPGLNIARRALTITRSTLLQTFTTTHLDPGLACLVEDPAPILAQLPALKYEGETLLGMGGMGEVWRVRDLRLNRRVAMKWLRAHRMQSESIRERFIQEAKLTAQLQHPGIVSVHEVGELEGGRPFFTMEEVRGRTLQELLDELHDESREGQWGATQEGYGLQRLIAIFHRACEAIAYAHDQGVIHRDIKPNNIMVGAYGEVQVLDWGLAKVTSNEGDPRDVSPPPTTHQDPIEAENDPENLFPDRTTLGSIVGTIPYMPPEQAQGLIDALGPAADVYALGASLYHMLSGRRPFEGTTAEVLKMLSDGPPQDVAIASKVGGVPPLPHGLPDICRRAMSRQPEARYQNADALAQALAAWLDGALRRSEAKKLLAKTNHLQKELIQAESDLKSTQSDLIQIKRTLKANAPISEKRALWRIENTQRALRGHLKRLEARYVEGIQAALSRDPDLSEAHGRLADHYHQLHKAAEARGDHAEAEGLAVRLLEHGAERHRAYLIGNGQLSMDTQPPGATVTLYPYESVDRRSVLGEAIELGESPIQGHALAMGSYVLQIKHPQCEPMRYPVFIKRNGNWQGLHPKDGPKTIALLPINSLAKDDRCVPAGPFLCGGDANAPNPWPHSNVWVDSFVMKENPVTNGQFLIFLNALVDEGNGEAALKYAPRERAGGQGESGALIYGRDKNGHFFLRKDVEGDEWLSDWPVILIDYEGSCAYAAWFAQNTGLPWRLPHELEWEKAARGVDGRAFPWGPDFEVCYAVMRLNPPGRRGPDPVGSHPEDESPYGVRGMAGNVGDWCQNSYDPNGAPPDIAPRNGGKDTGPGPRSKRGGGWPHDGPLLRSAERHGFRPDYRSGFLGFRLARSV